ncbi:substrate-binding domain-containing protein [Caldimonas brevitalea]|uniref:ABC transporter permease n=1 Tax=Caldimonas brevitalea TaxID=413882 RepID=A0A0G3BDN1_9BURK|nr:substrate-binding domain-containing protein [Caldimonas brevitalea]AKJ27524.1 ABC transporter permease [Caldimonas brevitalea]
MLTSPDGEWLLGWRRQARRWTGRVALAAAGVAWTASAQGAGEVRGEVRVAHIYSQTGPLEAYGRQTAIGFRLGLEYATGGTMTVASKRLAVVEHDDKGQPELGRALLAAAYSTGKADLAVGPTSSAVALAMLPVAAEHRKILIVEPAAADAITGERWNRYVFRTGRNSSQDAIANAIALDRPGLKLATLAQDSPFGRDGVRAFRAAIRRGQVVHEEYLPANTEDFTSAAQRLAERLQDQPGRKVVWVLWAGTGNPYSMADADLRQRGIELSTGGNTFEGMRQFNRLPGMQGATHYYYAFSRSRPNLWLVNQHFLRYQQPPDLFTAGGFAAAMAVVSALQRTGGGTEAQQLIRVMEGMSFDTPKGTMTLRREDHQALQSMYHFRVAAGASAGQVPDLRLVREIPAEDIAVPVRNRR